MSGSVEETVACPDCGHEHNIVVEYQPHEDSGEFECPGCGETVEWWAEFTVDITLDVVPQ